MAEWETVSNSPLGILVMMRFWPNIGLGPAMVEVGKTSHNYPMALTDNEALAVATAVLRRPENAKDALQFAADVLGLTVEQAQALQDPDRGFVRPSRLAAFMDAGTVDE